MTKYTIALASRGAVHYNGSLVIVLKLSFLQKIKIHLYIFSTFLFTQFRSYTLDYVHTLRIHAIAVDRLCVHTALMLSITQIGAILLHSKKLSIAISDR